MTDDEEAPARAATRPGRDRKGEEHKDLTPVPATKPVPYFIHVNPVTGRETRYETRPPGLRCLEVTRQGDAEHTWTSCLAWSVNEWGWAVMPYNHVNVTEIVPRGEGWIRVRRVRQNFGPPFIVEWKRPAARTDGY